MDKLPLLTEPFLTDSKQIKAWLDSVGVEGWSINAYGLVDVAGDVDLQRKLGELKRLPVRFGNVGGRFDCHKNQLVSLEGAPKKVGRSFDCANNQLVGLYGSPKKVGGWFYCSHNQLVSLEGAPEKVGGYFYCDHNLLVDFKGLEVVSIAGKLAVNNLKEAGQDNVFVSLEGLPKDLYGKVIGLDLVALLAVEVQHSGILDIEI